MVVTPGSGSFPSAHDQNSDHDYKQDSGDNSYDEICIHDISPLKRLRALDFIEHSLCLLR